MTAKLDKLGVEVRLAIKGGIATGEGQGGNKFFAKGEGKETGGAEGEQVLARFLVILEGRAGAFLAAVVSDSDGIGDDAGETAVVVLIAGEAESGQDVGTGAGQGDASVPVGRVLVGTGRLGRDL
jgi:hypothetical protein